MLWLIGDFLNRISAVTELAHANQRGVKRSVEKVYDFLFMHKGKLTSMQRDKAREHSYERVVITIDLARFYQIHFPAPYRL
ncbi:hypothetical protein [Glacieibacterium sp.]|uniref:hypothetical protein n=1 Tax=Glacieibacterium sp. TaxID=2860237 RepID=UPI003B00DEAA